MTTEHAPTAHDLVARWTEALSRHDLTAFASLLDESLDAAPFIARAEAVRAAHGRFVVTADEVIACGERIAWRWTLVAASGVTMHGANFQRLSPAGRVLEHWTISRERA